jgi:hypothetical protein
MLAQHKSGMAFQNAQKARTGWLALAGPCPKGAGGVVHPHAFHSLGPEHVHPAPHSPTLPAPH